MKTTLKAAKNALRAYASSSGDLNVIYIKDDLEFPDVGSTSNALNARWITTAGVTFVDLKDSSHWGVWKVAGGNSITLNQYQNLYALTSVQKAVMRVVCMADASPETGTDEWYVGFFYTVVSSYPCGVLMSQAQGFTGLPLANGGPGNVDPTTGLVAGTYNGSGASGSGVLGYLQTGFLPAANQWVDLVVVWTPTACRFYCAQEGQTPVLKASIHTTIPIGFAPPAIIQNNSAATNLYVDRIELSYEFSTTYNRFEGNSSLLKL